MSPDEIIADMRALNSSLNELGLYLKDLVGQPFSYFKMSYGDELTMHFGYPPPPGFGIKKRGDWILTTRASEWKITQRNTVLISDNEEGLAAIKNSNYIVPMWQVLDVKTFICVEEISSIGITLTFPEDIEFTIRPEIKEPEPDPELAKIELADWELFMPRNKFLQVGPGLRWKCLPSDKP